MFSQIFLKFGLFSLVSIVVLCAYWHLTTGSTSVTPNAHYRYVNTHLQPHFMKRLLEELDKPSPPQNLTKKHCSPLVFGMYDTGTNWMNQMIRLNCLRPKNDIYKVLRRCDEKLWKHVIGIKY